MALSDLNNSQTPPPLTGNSGPGPHMVEATARVVRVEGKMAVLETSRVSGCASCAMSGSCGTSSLGQILGQKRNLLRIRNSFDAKAGEQVIIGLPEGDLVLASLFAYMIPLLSMIGLALLTIAMGGSNGLAGMASLIGLGGGLWLAARITAGQRQRFTPRFLRRLNPATACAPSSPLSSFKPPYGGRK